MLSLLNRISAEEPNENLLSLSEAKQHCYETSTENDDLINFLIRVSREYAEAKTWRQLLPSTYVLYLDVFPKGIIELPKSPCIGVTSIKYYVDDVLTTITASDYQVDAVSEPARIKPDDTWPTVDDRLNAVEITFTAGYDRSDEQHNLPLKIKQAMMFIVKHYYDNRDMIAVNDGRSLDVSEIPKTADYLLDNESMRVFI